MPVSGDGKRKVVLPLWGAMVLVGTIVLLAFLLWSAKRRHPVHVTPQPFSRLEELMPSIAGLTGTTVLEGNGVRVLQDEAFFDALLEEVEKATTSISLESYVWWTGTVCDDVADALARKAGSGVEVRLLLDAFGSQSMDEGLEAKMREAGVRLHKYHPLRSWEFGSYNTRDHRKAAVIDGRVAFVFGHGFGSEWTSEAPHPPWRDTAVQLRGPIVAAVQSVFMENWMEVSGEVPMGEGLFPLLEPVGPVSGMVARSSAHGTVSSVELLFKLAIASAEEELLIQSPYFVPDPDMVELIAEAARSRGVRVRLMVPGAGGTDSALVHHAGHNFYSDLLEAGVEILEYDRTLLHQKILVVDGKWSHVGSTNFDARSFEINDEISLGLLDRSVAEDLGRAFERDSELCRRLDPETWRNRGSWHRALDAASALVNEQI